MGAFGNPWGVRYNPAHGRRRARVPREAPAGAGGLPDRLQGIPELAISPEGNRMNVIGHLACAGKAPGAFRFGTLLPDLLALHRRRARCHVLARHWRERSGTLPGADAVVAGIDFHHEVDRRFHKSALFEDLAAAIQTALRAASGTPGLKRFLPAHVLAELFLDHLLLRGEPALAPAFYGALKDRDGSLLAPFVSAHPLVDAGVFTDFLARLGRNRFLEDYQTREGLLWRMDRVLTRFGQRALESAEHSAVLDVFTRHAGETGDRLATFVAELRAEARVWMTAPAGAPAQPTLQPGFAS